MTYELLKKDGTFLGETDWNNNGIYAGTEYFYLYNNQIFERREPSNKFQYDGKTETFCVVSDVKQQLKENGYDYWVIEVLKDENIYNNLSKLYNVNPSIEL